jgi:hypothetical protein
MMNDANEETAMSQEYSLGWNDERSGERRKVKAEVFGSGSIRS